MSQKSLPPLQHPPDTTLADCPFRLPDCRCPTVVSCIHARLLWHQMGNGDAGLGVPATLLTEDNLKKLKN